MKQGIRRSGFTFDWLEHLPAIQQLRREQSQAAACGSGKQQTRTMTNAFPSACTINAAALYVLAASSLALTIRQIERRSIGAHDAATERHRLDLSALRRVQLVPSPEILFPAVPTTGSPEHRRSNRAVGFSGATLPAEPRHAPQAGRELRSIPGICRGCRYAGNAVG